MADPAGFKHGQQTCTILTKKFVYATNMLHADDAMKPPIGMSSVSCQCV